MAWSERLARVRLVKRNKFSSHCWWLAAGDRRYEAQKSRASCAVPYVSASADTGRVSFSGRSSDGDITFESSQD